MVSKVFRVINMIHDDGINNDGWVVHQNGNELFANNIYWRMNANGFRVGFTFSIKFPLGSLEDFIVDCDDSVDDEENEEIRLYIESIVSDALKGELLNDSNN